MKKNLLWLLAILMLASCSKEKKQSDFKQKVVFTYQIATEITISQLCGHSSVEVTKTYICCNPNIDDKVMQYFNLFT